MNEPTQQEIDHVVSRIRTLVEKHGGSSEELKNLRAVYEMFHRRPDNPTYGMLLGVLDGLERR